MVIHDDWMRTGGTPMTKRTPPYIWSGSKNDCVPSDHRPFWSSWLRWIQWIWRIWIQIVKNGCGVKIFQAQVIRRCRAVGVSNFGHSHLWVGPPFFKLRSTRNYWLYPLVNCPKNELENHHAIFMGKSTISTGPWLQCRYFDITRGYHGLPHQLPSLHGGPWGKSP